MPPKQSLSSEKASQLIHSIMGALQSWTKMLPKSSVTQAKQKAKEKLKTEEQVRLARVEERKHRAEHRREEELQETMLHDGDILPPAAAEPVDELELYTGTIIGGAGVCGYYAVHENVKHMPELLRGELCYARSGVGATGVKALEGKPGYIEWKLTHTDRRIIARVAGEYRGQPLYVFAREVTHAQVADVDIPALIPRVDALIPIIGGGAEPDAEPAAAVRTAPVATVAPPMHLPPYSVDPVPGTAAAGAFTSPPVHLPPFSTTVSSASSADAGDHSRSARTGDVRTSFYDSIRLLLQAYSDVVRYDKEVLGRARPEDLSNSFISLFEQRSNGREVLAAIGKMHTQAALGRLPPLHLSKLLEMCGILTLYYGEQSPLSLKYFIANIYDSRPPTDTIPVPVLSMIRSIIADLQSRSDPRGLLSAGIETLIAIEQRRRAECKVEFERSAFRLKEYAQQLVANPKLVARRVENRISELKAGHKVIVYDAKELQALLYEIQFCSKLELTEKGKTNPTQPAIIFHLKAGQETTVNNAKELQAFLDEIGFCSRLAPIKITGKANPIQLTTIFDKARSIKTAEVIRAIEGSGPNYVAPKEFRDLQNIGDIKTILMHKHLLITMVNRGMFGIFRNFFLTILETPLMEIGYFVVMVASVRNVKLAFPYVSYAKTALSIFMPGVSYILLRAFYSVSESYIFRHLLGTVIIFLYDLSCLLIYSRDINVDFSYRTLIQRSALRTLNVVGPAVVNDYVKSTYWISKCEVLNTISYIAIPFAIIVRYTKLLGVPLTLSTGLTLGAWFNFGFIYLYTRYIDDPQMQYDAALALSAIDNPYDVALALSAVDNPLSLKLLKKSADQGYPPAQYAVAMKIKSGDGFPKDLTLALDLLEQAAAKGYDVALLRLGYIYSRGEDVDANITRAMELFEQAAKKEVPEAKNIWMDLKKGRFDNHKPVLEDKYDLAKKYYYGTGVAKNLVLAAELFAECAEEGHPRAECHLAIIHSKGDGNVIKNLTKAAELLFSSMSQGHCTDAQDLMLLKAQGVDLDEACKHLAGRAEGPAADVYNQVCLF